MAPCQRPQYAQPMPPMWNIGSGVRLTVSRVELPSASDVFAAAGEVRCVVSTPFGTPVVPDVYICTITSPASPRPPGSRGSCAASHALVVLATTDQARRRRQRARSTSSATSRYARPGDQQRRPRVGEDRRQLRRREPPVERHEHRADLAAGEQQLEHLGRRAAEVGDARAGAHAAREQRLREPVRALVELRVRELALAVAQRHRARGAPPRSGGRRRRRARRAP